MEPVDQSSGGDERPPEVIEKVTRDRAARERFEQAAAEVLSVLREELGPEFEVVYKAI
jgi:hypothetical protein